MSECCACLFMKKEKRKNMSWASSRHKVSQTSFKIEVLKISPPLFPQSLKL